VLSRSRDTEFIKRIESLLKIAGMKFKLFRFHKRKVSFLVVNTVKYKPGIKKDSV